MDLIYPFVKIRSILQTISREQQNQTYQEIYRQIDKYIEDNCQHHVVQDLIDISPEHSQTIYYCEHCWKTFDRCIPT